jgi:AhpD family alkylhydroperoxidase
MAELAEMEWEDCLIPPRRDAELERYFKAHYGVVPPSVSFLSHSPWLVRAQAHTNYRRGQLVDLDPELADLIFLAVSQDNSCRFCYAAQRSALKILGFDEERIRRVEEAASAAETNDAESRVLDFARRLSRANPAPGAADWDALGEVGYSQNAIKEIAYIVSHTVSGNRTTTIPAIPTQAVEAFADRLVIRLLRPLIGAVLRTRIRRGEPGPLPAELREVPFAYIPLALDGLPVARSEAQFLALAWEPSALSNRAKALVFAVVARGLGSARSEREAKRLLTLEGFGEDQVEDVLAHLASPKLDPVEAAVVPFARETIRVRPAEIQRRAKKLLDTLEVEQFTDLVGVIGLANAVCRLSLFLCEA